MCGHLTERIPPFWVRTMPARVWTVLLPLTIAGTLFSPGLTFLLCKYQKKNINTFSRDTLRIKSGYMCRKCRVKHIVDTINNFPLQGESLCIIIPWWHMYAVATFSILSSYQVFKPRSLPCQSPLPKEPRSWVAYSLTRVVPLKKTREWETARNFGKAFEFPRLHEK